MRSLKRPSIVIIRRRHRRTNPCEVRRARDRREVLRGPHVRPAKHPHLSIRIRQRRRPFHRVVTVLRLVLERVPLAFRFKPPAHVLRNHHVPPRRGLEPEAHAPRLVVRRAHQQHGKFFFSFWPVNIRAQRHAIAHLRRNIPLHRDFVTLRRHCQRQDQCHPHHADREQPKTPRAIVAASHLLLHRYASTLCPVLAPESAPSLGGLLTAVKPRPSIPPQRISFSRKLLFTPGKRGTLSDKLTVRLHSSLSGLLP
jgi:hypothetical protein